MGRGGDGRASASAKKSMDINKLASSFKDDMVVLKNIWFGSKSGKDHAARLESFYGPQASAYDKFRASFLWGRKPMLAACAARLASRSNMVWVDLGGGTGENVDMMAQYIGLDKFKAIYIVDLCHSLCEVAKAKVKAKGWKNVLVVEGDACTFKPKEPKATLVTFSYSLSMIPPFHNAVDNAIEMLAEDGLLGATDFFVSSKYDLPMRQMSWARRFFWRSIFDIDSIDLGAERRSYLEHRLERVWEINSQGSIPYVPYFRAPYYVWIGQPHVTGHVAPENKVDRPALFPPTFLYTQSWEDPEPDMEVMDINEKDVCLTLTSGGCNALNLILHGAGEVVSVDCNPAQTALLELKKVAIQQLGFEDTWQLFGEGVHPHIEDIFEKKLAPFLSQTSNSFWSTRLWYFRDGLYYQGGMGKLCWVLQCLFAFVGLGKTLNKLANAPTLEEQQRIWDKNLIVHFVKHGPSALVWLFCKFISLVFCNRVVLWFGGGVPGKQYQLIKNDGIPIEAYVARTLDGVAEFSHLRKSNYFYYNCATGKFLRDNCPSYLREANFNKLKAGLIERLTVCTGTFLDELRARKYTKVILMDHIDWMDEEQATGVAKVLAEQVLPGGIVIWRSAALTPFYAEIIKKSGFDIKCISRADQGYMDRVNMYSSFYVAKRKTKRD